MNQGILENFFQTILSKIHLFFGTMETENGGNSYGTIFHI